MKTIFTLLFTLSALFSMAQNKEAWTPLLDSTGTEQVESERYLVLITKENASLNDAMKKEIDAWLSSMNTSSKKDRGIMVYKSEYVDHKENYDKMKEVARKNSLKGSWVVPK